MQKSLRLKLRRGQICLGVCFAALGIIAAGDLQAARRDDAARFADRMQDCKNNSANTLNDLDQMMADMQAIPALTHSDIPVVQKVMQGINDQYLAAAAAYGKGDQASGDHLFQAAQKAMQEDEGIIRQRLEVRGRERFLVMGQDEFEGQVGWMPPSFQPYFARAFLYRLRMIDTMNALAAALKPGADMQQVSHLRDIVERATTECDVAQKIATWSQNDATMMENPQITSDAMRQAMEQIRQGRQQFIDDYRKMKLLERETDQTDEQLRVLQQQREADYNAAQRAAR